MSEAANKTKTASLVLRSGFSGDWRSPEDGCTWRASDDWDPWEKDMRFHMNTTYLYPPENMEIIHHIQLQLVI